MSTWCVPGAPLENGDGWRIWYATEGSRNKKPRNVQVQTLSRQTVASTMDTEYIAPPPGFGRRIAVVDVKLTRPAPGRQFRVTIPELNRTFYWRTRPDGIGDKGTSFILASCFWQNDDGGHLQKAIDALLRFENPRPAFKLLVGDQVYLDYPFALKPWESPQTVTRNRNDFPEKQIQLSRTRGSKRDEYADLADEYYEKFQLVLNDTPMVNNAPKRWIQFTIDPASFFITDTRSERTFYEPKDGSDPAFMVPEQWNDLEAFRVGAFVLAFAGEQLLMHLLESVGDVLQKHQPEHHMLVLGRIHVVAELVRRQPQLRLKTKVRSLVGFLPAAPFLRHCSSVVHVFSRQYRSA